MEKDNKNELVSQKDSAVAEALGIFIKDQKSWFLYKKAEKISKAFFLITRHLADEHMLKSHIREKALDLMAKSQAIVSGQRPATEVVQGVVLEALSLISLSDIALASELQSERNHAVVVRELEIFIQDLSTWVSDKTTESYIPATLFDMSDIAPVVTKKEGSASTFYTAPVSHQRAPSKLQKPVTTIRTDVRKGGRQESIIQAVRSKGEVSIKDLVTVVKGCSEKTIQRELISLVNSGILSKTGERRWSRYSVV